MEAVDNPELRARLDELEQELEASYSHLLRALRPWACSLPVAD